MPPVEVFAIDEWRRLFEVNFFGPIAIIQTLQPALIRIAGGMTTQQRGRYARLMHSIVSQAEATIPKGAPAEEAGRVIADAITCNRPRTRCAALRPHFPKESK
jgi:NAD(P)-dependent dehydrogenase (short-subunit alcohol dehydrogenase family)